MDEDTVPNRLSDSDFGEENLIEAMNEFPSNSAAGPDGFPAMMLKQCRRSLAHPFFLIWKKSMNEGTLPDICKKANRLYYTHTKERVEPLRRTIVQSHLPLYWSKPWKRLSANTSSTSLMSMIC